MKHSALKTCFTLVVLFLNSLALAQAPSTSNAKDDGKNLHAQVKAQLLSSMRDVAKKENIAVDEARMFYGSLNDGLVAAVPAVGVEKLNAKDFADGQNIGVVYFSSAASTREKKEISPGTFVARIVGDPSAPNAKAQLLQKGKVVAEVTMQAPCKAPLDNMSLTDQLPLSGVMRNVADKQGQPVYTNAFLSGGRNDMAAMLAQEGGFTRCYGFVMYCKVGYGGGYYSDRWYWCGFCFGIWF
jgi:hypothetical protein